MVLSNAMNVSPAENYKVTIHNSSSHVDALRRQNDNALLGQNLITFASSASTATQFDLVSAQAISTNQVKVIFSENLAATSVTASDFSISGVTVSSVEIPYAGGYNTVLLTLGGGLTIGDYYTLLVSGVEAYSGKTLSAKNSDVFAAYAESSFMLQNAVANSATKVTLTFNKPPLSSTITPVNFEIKPTLGITNVGISGNNVILTTVLQAEETAYTVVAKADKLKDQSGRLISAQNTATFTGYKEKIPVIASVNPEQITNDVENVLLINGENFETGTKVYLNSVELTAMVGSTEISATVPVDQIAGVYDLILKRPNGEQIKQENAVVVEDPVQNITVISGDSKASPDTVPNDGTTKTTLWVRISDPLGVSDIDKVTLDLRPIDGIPAQDMIAGEIVDTKRWYSWEVTVPSTVSTTATAITIPVVAQNKAGDKAYGTVSLKISNDTTSSLPPVIEQARSTPIVLTPGAEEDVYFYAYVSDEDGADTISRVEIDLGAIDGPPMTMTSSSGSAIAAKGKWFKTSTAFRLPSNKRNPFYNLMIKATDATGETHDYTLTVKTAVNQNKPFVDEDRVSVISDT